MTTCAIKAKHWVLRHYLWVTVGLFVLVVVGLLWIQPNTWQDWIGILAVPLAFLVAVQKQKTEELTLFKELFEKFNARYDEMNEALNVIIAGDRNTPLTQEETDKLFNYFNLCGEEYLFYRQGYIYPEVWQAWSKGIEIFLDDPRIKQLWDKEINTGSYYGLRFEWRTSQQMPLLSVSLT
jgi:hypothetical protein